MYKRYKTKNNVSAVILSRYPLLIENRLEVLIIHNKKRGWEFPKGWVRNGEKVYGALIREIYEETGIKINENEVLPLKYKLRLGRSGGNIYNFFCITDIPNELRLDERIHDDFMVANFKNIKPLLGLHNDRKALGELVQRYQRISSKELILRNAIPQNEEFRKIFMDVLGSYYAEYVARN